MRSPQTTAAFDIKHKLLRQSHSYFQKHLSLLWLWPEIEQSKLRLAEIDMAGKTGNPMFLEDRNPEKNKVLQSQLKSDPAVNRDVTDEYGASKQMYSPKADQISQDATPSAIDTGPQNFNEEATMIKRHRTTFNFDNVANHDNSDDTKIDQIKSILSDDNPKNPDQKTLSRSSTAEMREELSKYKLISESASRLCHEVRSMLDESTTEKLTGKKREQLERSLTEILSISGDEQPSQQLKTSHQKADSVDILYRVRLLEDGKSDKYWYQDVPFPGIDLERTDPPETESISIFDVVIDIVGTTQSKDLPPGEERNNWKGRKNIDFGKDINITRQKNPAISIKAPLLLSALKSLITYYPSQDDISWIAHPYKVLLQHYPLLAAFRSTCKTKVKNIDVHLLFSKDKLQQCEPALVSRLVRPTLIDRAETSSRETDCYRNTLQNDSPTPLTATDGQTPGRELSPEQQIQDILDSKTSLEPDTDKPWKDHEFGDRQCDEETAYQIGVMLAYLAPIYHKHMVPELENHLDKGKASFKRLWILFQPGIDVYGLLNGQYSGFVVQSCEYIDGDKTAKMRQYRVERCAVKVWSLRYTGDKIHRDAKCFYIPEFEGFRDIDSFEVFPKKYMNESEKKWLQLQKRGQTYFDIVRQNPAHRLYQGHTLGRASKKYEGGIIIDPRGYIECHTGREYEASLNERADMSFRDMLLFNPSLSAQDALQEFTNEPSDHGGGTRWKEYNDIDPTTTEQLSEHQKFLLPRHTLGFLLNTKEWKILEVDCIRDVPDYTGFMNNLLFPAKGDHKKTISAFLSEYSSTPADFVDQKGQSRVILLHGKPGTGKTYTVECIAKEKKRPLLSLTVADLGSSEELMEKRLSTWFRLAESWGAIMLIDEADVFLEERVPGDLRRNCLIAVFLRTMEYYSGILFLTSNRVGQIDTAFASRILLVLGYELLPGELRQRLWEMFFAMYTKNDKNIKFARDAQKWVQSDEVTEMDLNGRAIRNAIQGAILLAREEKKQSEALPDDNPEELRIEMDHFKEILTHHRDFKKYTTEIHDMPEGERAWRLGNRKNEGSITPDA
ncbi:hypothetical protein ACLMJK_006160 [Lecanora helva]